MRLRSATLVAVVTAAALVLPSCGSTAPGDEDYEAFVLATVPGIWQASALGGTWVITLNVGGLDPATHTAPITGSGTFQQNQFTVTGTLGGKTKLGTEELGIVKLDWTTPYQGSAKPFSFSGGLADVQFSASTQLSGTLTTTGTSIAVIFDRR